MKDKPVQFIQCSEEQIRKMGAKNESVAVEDTENETKIYFDPNKVYFEVKMSKGNTLKMDGKVVEKLEWWKDED